MNSRASSQATQRRLNLRADPNDSISFQQSIFSSEEKHIDYESLLQELTWKLENTVDTLQQTQKIRDKYETALQELENENLQIMQENISLKEEVEILKLKLSKYESTIKIESEDFQVQAQPDSLDQSGKPDSFKDQMNRLQSLCSYQEQLMKKYVSSLSEENEENTRLHFFISDLQKEKKQLICRNQTIEVLRHEEEGSIFGGNIVKPTFPSVQDLQPLSKSSGKPSLEDELKSLEVNSQFTEHDFSREEVGKQLIRDVKELEQDVEDIHDTLSNTEELLKNAVRYSSPELIEYPAYMSLWQLQDALLFSSFIAL